MGQAADSTPRGLVVLGITPGTGREQILFSYLAAGGYHCRLGTPKEVAESRPLGVVLDISPHSHDGWGLLQQLKSDIATRNIPILPVFLSETGKVGGVFPVAGFFTAPLDTTYLLDRLAVLGLTEDAETWDLQALVVTRNGDQKLTQALESPGFEIINAYTGNEALALASIRPKYMAFSSMMLSDMSAFELQEKMRLSPYNRNIPFFVVIKEDMKEGEKLALSREISHLVSKRQLSCEEFLLYLKPRE